MSNSIKRFFVALTLHLLVLDTATAQDASEPLSTDISLAGILDTSNLHWAGTIFSVTIDLLNDKNNGFFDKELESLGKISYQLLDAACDGFTALSSYWDVRPVDGVIGARCSGASTPLAWMGALDNVPQISMASTSVKLSNKNEFPTFSRVVSPDDKRGQVGALVSAMGLFEWDRITIINTDTPYAKDLATSFQGLWKGEVAYLATVKLLSNGEIDESSAIKVLEEAPLDDPINNSKVVLLIGHNQHAFPILKIAKDFFPEETFWIGPDAWVGRMPPLVDWMPEVPGYLGVVPFRNRGSMYQQFLQLGGTRLTPILNDEGHLPDHTSQYTVDSIIAMVMALANTPIDLRDDGLRVATTLRTLDFDGVSGRVRFTIEGDRKDPQFSIMNLQNVRGGNQSSRMLPDLMDRDIDIDGNETFDTKNPLSVPTPTPSEQPFSPSDWGLSSATSFSPSDWGLTDTSLEWVEVGRTGNEADSANFGPNGIQGVCFASVGCGLNFAPDDSPPLPLDRIDVWVPVTIFVLCSVFLSSFWLYRRKKIQASRRTKAILAAKVDELNDYRNSVVDMRTAEVQYVPKLANLSSSNDLELVTSRDQWCWCWKETNGFMKNWDDDMIEGNRSDCWIKYDNSSNYLLELAYQEQGHAGQCIPLYGYTVDFGIMVQTKDATKFQREVKRCKVAMQNQAFNISSFLGACSITIAKEPQMILIPGDIVQISKKRDDGWAYGSKLHLEDEPLGRRLVQLVHASQDNSSKSDNDGETGGSYIIEDNHGWFPMNVTRVPNTDDLAILRNALGGADNLAAPESWDKIADPSVVQKSNPLDKTSQEYRKVADAFMSTLPPTIKIVSIQRIQNMAMWQSYIVKRKTVIDRDKSLGGASGLKQALSRFERSWLWHGTNEDSVEKIIQQGFNRSFCGKNATYYGKGVYFARDASYSYDDTYSPPNSSGHKYVLACSVVVGEFCKGLQDARTPDLRDAARNILYDSTVNDLSNPILYVTYHDAQAYPEYLIIFKEKVKSKMF